MTTLTRLAPDAVLRNVMPIFTFMGSNVFHRDDTYSFRVVQKVCNSLLRNLDGAWTDCRVADYRWDCPRDGKLAQDSSRREVRTSSRIPIVLAYLQRCGQPHSSPQTITVSILSKISATYRLIQVAQFLRTFGRGPRSSGLPRTYLLALSRESIKQSRTPSHSGQSFNSGIVARYPSAPQRRAAIIRKLHDL